MVAATKKILHFGSLFPKGVLRKLTIMHGGGNWFSVFAKKLR